MTNNDELAMKLKDAAEKALPAMQRLLMMPNDELFDELFDEALLNVDGDVDLANEFNVLAGPENILSLLAEREADKKRIAEYDEALCKLLPGIQYMDPPDGGSVTPLEQVSRMVAVYRNRIAELEARTVSVKPGEVLVTVSGFTGCAKSAIAGEIEIAMRAIGVPVTWSNGDTEKRTMGADWLTAIEMYKPTVRIVEINVPRAGIKLEVGE